MEKTEIKDKLAEVKAALKANSKDAHYADKLIADMLSLKGQLDVEPALINIPMNEVLGSVEFSTFVIYKTSLGMFYQQRNGFEYFIPLNGYTNGLYEVLSYLVDNKDTIKDAPDDEKELYDSFVADVSEVMTMPISLCFPYIEFYKFRAETISGIIALLNKILEDSIENLEPEDYEANAEFRQVTESLENIKDEALRDE